MYACQESLAFHFKDGIAAERLVTDPAVFQRIVAAAQQTTHNTSVGGNAALMARRFSELPGASVLLGGVVGAELRALLGSGVRFVFTLLHGSARFSITFAATNAWGAGVQLSPL